MRKNLSIGIDIGGTHITCATVHLETGRILSKTIARESFRHEDAANLILRSWAIALNRSLLKTDESQLAGLGFAIPGPFDYRNGLSKMKHKFPHLYDIHIPTALNPLLLDDRDLPMRFLNDATAFALGEAWKGAGKAVEKVVVITLGTGFGSAFVDNCIPVVSGDHVPTEGCLWHLPFKEGIADDYFSTRWFLNAYRKQAGKEISGVKELAVQAEKNGLAKNLFEQFGNNLAECLAPWLKKFGAEILIAGGNIAHTMPLFEPAFQVAIKKAGLKLSIVPSSLMEKAALIGSARLLDDEYWDKISAELPAI